MLWELTRIVVNVVIVLMASLMGLLSIEITCALIKEIKEEKNVHEERDEK